MTVHREEVSAGERFAFGRNWRRFLASVNDERIRQAERALAAMLGRSDLAGETFLDVGCGSGLMSLAARKLGARVHSFDFDPESVACAASLRSRYLPGDDQWTLGEGSVLDRAYLAGLGQWSIVYSWGVLHHTGAMWEALDNVASRVAPGGRLFIAIYNDQGGMSRRWLRIKKTYNRLPRLLQTPFALLVMMPREALFLAAMTAQGRPWAYFEERLNYSRTSLRGMSWWHDLIDWVGGLPFEVARPEQVFDYYRDRGFSLERLVTQAGGLGCNEFVFRAPAPGATPATGLVTQGS